MKRTILLAGALLVLAVGPASAHTGVGSVSGVGAGFAHPIGGLDHVLAMIAVGILAVQLSGRAIWTVPLAFVGMMVVGGAFGVLGVPVPFVEQGILGSVLILGAVIAVGRRIPLPLAMILVGVLAVFHGHAHGAEMPTDASGYLYGLGFALATASLHLFGIGLGLGARRLAFTVAPAGLRIGGAAIALAGVGLVLS